MCCTGFGLPAGIIFIFVWAFKQLQDKGISVNYNDKKTDNIEEEITSKANWHQYT